MAERSNIILDVMNQDLGQDPELDGVEMIVHKLTDRDETVPGAASDHVFVDAVR